MLTSPKTPLFIPLLNLNLNLNRNRNRNLNLLDCFMERFCFLTLSPRDMEAKCSLLSDELRKMLPAEIRSFQEHLNSCWHRAYSWFSFYEHRHLLGRGFVGCSVCISSS